MQFKTFENKTNPTEYLQIFIYHKLHINGVTEIEIDEYLTFELTDTLINSFNAWVSDENHIDSLVVKWIKLNPEKVDYFVSNFPTKFKPKVAIWSDRKKTTYYKEKLQDSFDFENYIAELISEKYGLDLGQYLTPEGQYELGENALGIEIKNDTLIQKYGNVYIEYQEKSKGSNYSYVNSGILKIDNCIYFLIGTVEKFYIFRKNVLINILNEELANLKNGIKSSRNIVFKQIATSKGYVYPVKNAINDTISMDTMINEIKDQLNLK
jgi:hypothetical protein